MAVPYEPKGLPAVTTLDFNVSHWGGVNSTKGYTADYEMVDCKNMGGDNYPYASPKKADKKMIAEDGIKRIYKIDGNKIYYIDKDEYLCFGEDGIKNYVVDKDGNKIQMNNVSCTNNYDDGTIFYPEMKYMNYENDIKTPSHSFWWNDTYVKSKYGGVTTITYTAGAVEINNSKNRKLKAKVILPIEYDDNEPIPDEEYGYPIKITDLHVYLEAVVYDENLVEKYRVKALTGDYGHAYITGRENVYDFEFSEDAVFKEGYVVMLDLKVSGALTSYSINTFVAQADYIKNGEWSYVCDDITESVFMYEFDYGVIFNNRVVCCKGSDIRLSGEGNYANFTQYIDEAGNADPTGADATNVGSAGEFTGIYGYNNVVLLFKRDIVYEMYGVMPFVITELCKTGCVDNDSIVSIDGVLYWASPKGIVRYGGGAPTVISTQIDIDTSDICKAGTDGRKYYVFDGKRTFVYDTYYQMWHIWDNKEIGMMYNHITELYFVGNDGIYKAGAGSEWVEWEFETKDYTLGSKERKNLSKLWLRADMPKHSRLEVYVRQNGGEWQRVAVKTAENDEMFDFKLRIKKCDSFAIKFKGKGDIRILDIHGKVTIGTSKHRSGESLKVYRK